MYMYVSLNQKLYIEKDLSGLSFTTITLNTCYV